MSNEEVIRSPNPRRMTIISALNCKKLSLFLFLF